MIMISVIIIPVMFKMMGLSRVMMMVTILIDKKN